MPAKKPRAKIKRNIARALARGEVYEPPQWFIDEQEAAGAPTDDDNRWYSEKELSEMTAKDRRQKKRMMKSLGLTGPPPGVEGDDEKVPTKEELEKVRLGE